LTDTQVIVARNDRTHDLAVAFRGSESALDWINDAIATRTDYPLPDGRVIEDSAHLGFAAALAAVEQQLLAVLQANDRSMLDGTRVYFTGHSLGGALATLGSLRFAGALQQLGYTADEIVTYTFGAPRSMTLELVGHHDALLPNTFAVANSDDPVPHLLNSSRSDRYSHVDEMVVWTSDEPADLMRIDRGDGRDYAGCSELTASNSAKLGNFGDHGRDEYDRRLSITNFAGPPSVSLSIPQDSGIYSHEFRMHWDAAVEGPCDRVGMWQVAGTLAQATVDTRTPLSSRNVKVDTNDIHSTGDDKGFDHWIAYTNIFGDIVASREYRPSTPEVWLTVNDNGIFPDTIDLNWSVSDAGSKDLIILYDRDPSQLSDLTDWYVSPVGRVEARATTNSPERKQTFVSTRDVWWVGYVMEDNNGRLWLLDSKRGFGR
ncbi:MAG: lipase family protein, partial [Actinomycetota bacterium]